MISLAERLRKVCTYVDIMADKTVIQPSKMRERAYFLRERLLEGRQRAHGGVRDLPRACHPLVADGDEREHAGDVGVRLQRDVEEQLLGLARPDQVVDDQDGVAGVDGARGEVVGELDPGGEPLARLDELLDRGLLRLLGVREARVEER